MDCKDKRNIRLGMFCLFTCFLLYSTSFCQTKSCWTCGLNRYRFYLEYPLNRQPQRQRAGNLPRLR